MATTNKKPWGPGKYILRYRLPIGLVLIGITVFMAYWALRIQIATRFENFFPANHVDVQLYRKYRTSYGGAQTLILLLRVHNGNIFNFKTLQQIQDISFDIDRIPGVNHGDIISLASVMATFEKVRPGELIIKRFMYPDVPKTQQQLDELKKNVRLYRANAAGLVTSDDKGALIRASFNDYSVDYRKLFDGVQNILDHYQNGNTTIYVAGQPAISAWGYHYLPRIAVIFIASIILMLMILYLSVGQRSSWWAPILTGSFSAIWGLGFVSLMGYDFDPVMLVIPFILTARDLSHGIQWQGRYYDELDLLDDKFLACSTTTDVMLGPGLLSILADIAGIIFISLGGIPVLKEIGFGGTVWLAASVLMVFVFQPIFMSYLPRPTVRERRWWRRSIASGGTTRFHSAIDWLVKVPVTPGLMRSGLLVGGAAFIVWGIASGQRARIGYETPGTPLYRPDAKINQDTAEILKYYPIDEGWVVLEGPDYGNPQTTIAPNVLKMTDDMGAYLMTRGDVSAVGSFASSTVKYVLRMLQYGHPKFDATPSLMQVSGNIWGFAGAGNGRFFAVARGTKTTCIRVSLPDHTYLRLNRVRAQIDNFVRQRVAGNPELSQLKVIYLGGEAGLYLAANDILYRLDLINITFVLLVILLCCAFAFRSVVAGALFVVSCIMANFGAFVFMNFRHIGLTIDTIPVISLGIGLGVDYGIYTVARIRDEVIGGATIEDAISTALGTTGAAVFSTFAVMIGGIFPWVFSPLLFHNEMSVLLIFLMGTNMIAGVLILPSFIAWRRPRFIARYEKKGPEQMAAAGA